MTTARGQTQRGRERAAGALRALPAARGLVRAEDHGEPIRVEGKTVGEAGDRWVEPFIEANRAQFDRLGVRADVDVRRGVALRLTPGSRIGAVPLVSSATRRVSAGMLVSPRFQWSSLGAVLGDIGFQTEPTLGGGPLVPGSAREVPAWMLAAPVLARIESMLAHRKRGFVERHEVRLSPRGRVDWTRWAREHVPSGRWSSLPCAFPDPDDDPELLASVRWTLSRLEDDLGHFHEETAARLLRIRVADLQARVGSGATRRPATSEGSLSSGWVADAVQAMGWVAEERGLGGSRALDGLSWDLAIEEVWEAWVDAFVAELAPRCGLVPVRRGHTRRPLNWSTRVASMTSLIPDVGLRGSGRVVWVDAKYKAHLQQIAAKGWNALGEDVRDRHRADLHQALAYASLDDVERVDSILAYPERSSSEPGPPAVATVAAGRRRVRLLLVGLPFGFRSVEHRDASLTRWRDLIAYDAASRE